MGKKIEWTPEHVRRTLELERQNLSQHEARAEDSRKRITVLERTLRRLEAESVNGRKPLKRVKIESSKYEMRDGDTTVAVVVRTGEYSRDDYPWDWYLADGWTMTEDAPRYLQRAQGNSDIMRDCVETVQIAWRDGHIVEKGA